MDYIEMESNSSFGDAIDYSDEDIEEIPSLRGVVCKWTNYLYGWQERFVCCKEGTLSYYLSQRDTEHGCRGSISLLKSEIEVSEFDPCRFDVKIDDNVWYLRAPTEDERNQWVEVIKANQLDLDVVSVRSSTFFRSAHGLKEKLAELESFRDILERQVRVLQKCYETCVERSPNNRLITNTNNNGEYTDKMLPKVDIRGEALIFKETTRGALNTLSLCMEMLNIREEETRNRREKSYELRTTSKSFNGNSLPKTAEIGVQTDFSATLEERCSDDEIPTVDDSGKTTHRFSKQLEERVKDHLKNSLTPQHENDTWELIAEDYELKVYRMEMVVNGVICDPLKMTHSVTGITGRELCYYFWCPEVRMDWEETVETFRVVEVIDDWSAVMHQIHKRVWPTAQRDCLYFASMFAMDNPEHLADNPPKNTWMSCNFSVEHEDVVLEYGCLRAVAEICLYCHTYVTEHGDRPLDRDSLRCDVTYVANINPGGWAPAAALRAIYKREYPKFLRRLSTFAQTKTKGKEIWF